MNFAKKSKIIEYFPVYEQLVAVSLVFLATIGNVVEVKRLEYFFFAIFFTAIFRHMVFPGLFAPKWSSINSVSKKIGDLNSWAQVGILIFCLSTSINPIIGMLNSAYPMIDAVVRFGWLILFFMFSVIYSYYSNNSSRVISIPVLFLTRPVATIK